MLTWKLLSITTLFLNTIASQEDDYESISAELHLADYDLADAYDEISQAHKNILLGTGGFEEKVKAELQRGIIMRRQYENNLDLETKVPPELQRNWTLLTRSGDFLLQESDFETLVQFHNANELLDLHSNIPCVNDQKDCSINKQDFEDILAKSRDAFELSRLWEARQNVFIEDAHCFGDLLGLVNKAYVPNGQHSAIAYWEMLSEHEEGYAKAKVLWNQVVPLYKKLHAFVKTRLYKYYNITSNSDLLPVYLLGSNFGDNWSNIADIVLPHPYLYTEVNNELKHQTVKDIFKAAEKTSRIMGLGPIRSFFTESIFNYTSCGPYIFSHCGSKKSEVVTCKKLGWNEYLNIYETYINIALRSEDYQSFPRMQTRFSAVDEALIGIGSILAINDLSKNEIILQNLFSQEVDDKYNRKSTSLLLLALRILPKLSYYLVADTWRLEELKFSHGNFTERWWKNRNGVQGIQGLTGLEADFLADPYVTGNKPYLSKFFGIFLQFQIMDYYQRYFASENEPIEQAIGQDENFRKLIKDRPNKSWLELISVYYGINQISSSELLEYFKPLEDYLDNAPLEQVVIPVIANPKHTTTSSTTISTNNRASNTTSLKNDVNGSDPNVVTKASTSETIGVFGAILGLITVSLLVFLIVRILKKKQQKHINIRKYEMS